MKHATLHLLSALLLAGFVAVSLGCSAKNQIAGQQITADNGEGRTYKVGSFSGIDAGTNAEIHFMQGKTTSVRAVCKKGNIDWLDVHTQGPTLIVTTSRQKPGNAPFSVVVYITAPTLTDLDISGNVSFDCPSLDVPHLDLDISGNVAIDLGPVKAANSKMDISGNTSLKMKSLEGNRLTMDNSGNSAIDIDFKGGSVDLEISGNTGMKFHFTGDNISIDNSGNSHVTATVDCKKLKASNSGNASLTLKGTADDTKIDNQGVVKINTSGLNNY